MSPSATEIKLDEAALRELEGSFRGQLVAPAGQRLRRAAQGLERLDRSPPGADRALRGGRGRGGGRALRAAHDLLVAVRGGGHSFPGLSTCDGGIVIDLGLMNEIRVDPEARTARAGAGVLWGELDRATQAFGLATTGGIVTHTGIAGLTLGGGIGWLQRKHGLTIDQLLARGAHHRPTGERVRASATENADLFWGLRGGGGNFGIVTEFEFRLHPVGPTVLAGPIFWPIEQSPAVLRFYRDWIADAPDELMTIVIHRKAPPLDFVPPELHGELVVAVVCCYAGPLEQGAEVVRPLKAFGSPVLDLCEPKPYVAHQAMFDPSFPHGRCYYMRACDVAELTDEVIDITVEHSLRIRSPLTTFPIWQMGGAVARVPEDQTAFNGRAAGHTFNITGHDRDGRGLRRRSGSGRATSGRPCEPHHTSVYVNFLMDEGDDRVREAYGAEKYDRLRTLKRRYDPDNLFRLNQNIPPA